MFGIDVRPAVLVTADGNPLDSTAVLDLARYQDTWISDALKPEDFLDMFYRYMYTLVTMGAVPPYSDEMLARACIESARATLRVFMEHDPKAWMGQMIEMGLWLSLHGVWNGAMALVTSAGQSAWTILDDLLDEEVRDDGAFVTLLIMHAVKLLAMVVMVSVEYIQEEAGVRLEAIAPFAD